LISKYAARAFLDRPLRDTNRFREKSHQWVASMLATMHPTPRFETAPRHHQNICFWLCIKRKELVLWLDMGTGKTKIMLDVFRQLRRQGDAKRCLVLVPTLSTVETWREQRKTHAPDLSFRTCTGDLTKKAKTRLIERGKAHIVVLTYQGWLSLVSKTVKKKKRRRWTLDKPLLRRLASQFDMVVYDEVTALQNNLSLVFRASRAMRKIITYRYGLTGTPFGRHPQDIWAQFYAVDGGAALGKTLGLFRAAFFTRSDNYWGGYIYNFRKRQTRDLRRMVAHSSIRFGNEHCPDLPPLVRLRRPLRFHAGALDHYADLREQWRDARGRVDVLQSVFLRARQLASGYITGVDALGNRQYARLRSVKMDDFLEFLWEVGPKEKVVVFHEYIYTGSWLSEVLGNQRIGHERLYSGTRDRGAVLTRFNTDPTCRVLLVNNTSGALGLNLQKARYGYFFESPVDPKIRRQAECRLHRQGQKRRTYLVDPYIRNSVDERIVEYLRQGKDLFAALVDGREVL